MDLRTYKIIFFFLCLFAFRSGSLFVENINWTPPPPHLENLLNLNDRKAPINLYFQCSSKLISWLPTANTVFRGEPCGNKGENVQWSEGKKNQARYLPIQTRLCLIFSESTTKLIHGDAVWNVSLLNSHWRSMVGRNERKWLFLFGTHVPNSPNVCRNMTNQVTKLMTRI